MKFTIQEGLIDRINNCDAYACEYMQVSVNRATGEIFGDFHTSIGVNEMTDYHDPDIITVAMLGDRTSPCEGFYGRIFAVCDLYGYDKPESNLIEAAKFAIEEQKERDYWRKQDERMTAQERAECDAKIAEYERKINEFLARF